MTPPMTQQDVAAAVGRLREQQAERDSVKSPAGGICVSRGDLRALLSAFDALQQRSGAVERERVAAEIETAFSEYFECRAAYRSVARNAADRIIAILGGQSCP